MNPGTKDALFRLWTGVHRAIFNATGGRVLGHTAGMPVVMLTTTGRRSGQPRQTMLTSPVEQGESLVLVASHGGHDRHPAWFLNLRDNPDVTATVHGKTREMRARVASEDEKRELWPRVTGAYRGYGSYQTKTQRDIPLVILEPR